jgi:hypothetical protein
LTAITDYGLEVEESINWHCMNVRHGLFSHVSRVCADAGNGLMWCAGDNGRRIKAFRAQSREGLRCPSTGVLRASGVRATGCSCSTR